MLHIAITVLVLPVPIFVRNGLSKSGYHYVVETFIETLVTTNEADNLITSQSPQNL